MRLAGHGISGKESDPGKGTDRRAAGVEHLEAGRTVGVEWVRRATGRIGEAKLDASDLGRPFGVTHPG